MPPVLSKLGGKKAKRSHNENRRLICALCLSKDLKCIPISQKLEEDIKHHSRPEFDLQVYSYPAGLCPYCRGKLFKLKSGEIKERPSSWSCDLSHFSSNRDCESCTVCDMAQSKARKQSKTKKAGQSSVKLCKTCYGILGKGINHKCMVKKQADNLLEIFEDPSSQEKITSKLLKNIQKGRADGDELSLKTGMYIVH